MNLVLTAVVVALHFAVIVRAVTHLHRGPVNAHAPPVTLRGTVVVDKHDGNGSPADFKRIPWSAKILRDVVFWYELDKDEAKITSCSSDHVTLRGDKVNRTDYAMGTVFVIDEEQWENHCAKVIPDPDIPQGDQILFYAIKSAPVISADGSVKLTVKRIAGFYVMPEVRLSLGANQTVPAPNAQLGETEIFSSNALGASMRQGVVFEPAERFRLGDTYTLADGVKLKWSTAMALHMDDIRFVRRRAVFGLVGPRVPIGIEWDQRFVTAANARITAGASLDLKKPFDILPRTAVPGLGFSGYLPVLLGHYSVGVSVKLEALFELKAEAGFVIHFGVRHEMRQTVRVTPWDVNVIPRRPLMPQPTVTGGLGFERSVYGFAGLGPSFLVGVEAHKKTLADVNAGVKLGVELYTDLNYDPHFQRYLGPGALIGICHWCHHLRAHLDVVIKDLELRAELFNIVVLRAISDWRFRHRVLTLCLLKSRGFCEEP